VSELARRVLVALVGIPLALGIIWYGDAALAALLGVIAALGAWEFFRIARAGGSDPLATIGIPLAAAIPLVVHADRLGYTLGSATPVGLVLTLGVGAALVVFSVAIWTRGVDGRPLTAVAVTVFGALYAGATLSYGYLLRYHNYAVGAAAGTALLMLPVLLTWAQDTGAYAVGRTIGRHKLIPGVSPGKTVEGAVGGVIITIVVAWIYVRFALIPYAQLALRPRDMIVFGLVISIAAQVGDLAESLIKREAGVKDSSRIIPGHGGILDRFDSLLFVLPVAYLLLGWMLIPAPAGR
jgi:phosphatidate cytidylyltransferase